LSKKDDIHELFSFGVLDKRKDLFADYAEYRMLKVINDAHNKGLSGEKFGENVFDRLSEELADDPYFLESFKYYLAKHDKKLELSLVAMAAFGELIIAASRMLRRMGAGALRAAGMVPVVGPIASFFADGIDAIGEIGDSIGRSVKRRVNNNDDEKIS